MITRILSRENPQLVVINGDLVSGSDLSTPTESNKYLHHVVAPLVEEGYLWASTYGNHDSFPNLDPKQDVYDQEKTYKNSLTQSMVSDSDAGITNYYLPVYSHDEGESDIPALVLWFFDSRGGRLPTNRVLKRSKPEIRRGDWVHQSV